MSLAAPPRSTVARATLGAGPVAPLRPTMLRPLPGTGVVLTDGLLGRLQRSNDQLSIPGGAEHLEQVGAWRNFDQTAAGDLSGDYCGPCYEDGESYKWLEAVAWEAARVDDPRLLDWLADRSARIGAAQADDGYLNTFIQRGRRASRYEQLAWDHEIFNVGALIQSAIAQFRTTGCTELLEIARRAADHLNATFGPDKIHGTCGHPLVEMALVELYRTTGDPQHLELARYFVECRGHDLVDPVHRWADDYHSDRVPVRETTVPEGHAVRAIYFAAGATDVAIETGDTELLGQLQVQWQTMVEQKMYVTGGLGARWEGEAFGDPYELPSDRAYAETCAAIAGMQWSWRLLLATGKSRYADLFERQLYNAVLPGLAADSNAYFYVNALQVHEGAVAVESRMAAAGRQAWFGTSCCPTSLMRTLASLQNYAATSTETGVQLHLLTASTVSAELAAGTLRFRVDTAYPYDGSIVITIDEAPNAEVAVSVRIPDWAVGATASGPDGDLAATAGSYLEVTRNWRAGDTLRVQLPIHARLTPGRHRVDAERGCVAIERGPLVYAVEQIDQPDGAVEGLTLSGAEMTSEFDAGLLDGVVVVRAAGAVRELDGTLRPVRVTALPYFRWANRGIGPMRIWIPLVSD